MTESREPTERDRFWLDHETAIKCKRSTNPMFRNQRN